MPEGGSTRTIRSMRRMRLRLTPWQGVTLGLVALSIAALSAGEGIPAAALHDSIGPLAAVASAAGVLVRRPRRRSPWLLLSAGMLSLGLGDAAFESGWGAGNGLYVAGLVLLALSLGLLVDTSREGRAARMLFVDAAAVFVAAMTALWLFVFDGRFESVSPTVSARLDFMAFPVLDVFLLALAARLALTGALRLASYRLLAAGMAFGGVGDLLWRGLGAGGYSTVWVSSSYYASYVLLAAAALHPSMRELVEVRVSEEQTLTRLRVLFLGCSFAVVPILLVIRHGQLRGDLRDFTVLAVAATLIPLLVGYRLVDLARIARATAAALRGSEELYRHVVEGSPSVICLLDTDANVVYLSPAAERLSGYSNKEACGREVWELLQSDDEATLRETFAATAAGGVFNLTTIHAKTKAGDDLVLETTAALMRESGQGDLVLAIAHDATKEAGAEAERKALEQRLQQAEKMEAIGQLAGGIAHDFNNLLLAIRGYGELAAREIQMNDLGTAERDIQEVLLAAERAADLTRQLLAFGRRQVLLPELLDLNDLICDTARLLGPLLDAPIELLVLPADETVLVCADRGQLTQVVTNLAINARDAMPDGGTLTIGAAAAGTEAELTVTDTGSGMSSETVAHIFEPFFTTKAGTGTGMGLATVQGIVDQSGGSIAVETQPDRGTCFTIRLPLIRAEPASDDEETAAADDSVHAGTVLLIEDTPIVRAVVRAFLEADGYSILEAERGEDALALARAHDGAIDVALTDIVLPGIDGRRAADELRADRPGLKVLYMSGYTNDSELLAGRLPARTAFIQKPFTGAELRAAMLSLAVDG